MPIGDRVKALRKQKGWSAGQLLVQARRHIPDGKRFARETLSRVENGQPSVDLWIIEALAQALGVSVGELLDEPPAFGQPWDIIAPPATRALVARLDALPDDVRARLLPVLSDLLDVFSGDGVRAVSAAERELLALYGQLRAEDRADLLELAQERAARRATDFSAADAAQSG